MPSVLSKRPQSVDPRMDGIKERHAGPLNKLKQIKTSHTRLFYVILLKHVITLLYNTVVVHECKKYKVKK